MQTRRPIQIAIEPPTEVEHVITEATLYALCDDGSLWFMQQIGAPEEWEWFRIRDVPQDTLPQLQFQRVGKMWHWRIETEEQFTAWSVGYEEYDDARDVGVAELERLQNAKTKE